MQLDITKHRELELAMADLTAQLQSNDLRKNEFLAMLAHELRNPLAPLQTGLDVLDRMSAGDTGRPAVHQMMHRQVQQMVRLVDDLLDVSRVSSGKITLRIETLDLAEVLQNAVEVIGPSIESCEQTLSVETLTAPLFVRGDCARLTQLLGNLLNNASKFSGSHGHVTLRARSENGHALIEVEDDGIGLCAEELPRIFELFAQVDCSPERNTSGLGIGLTLVQELARLHGGTVTARSQGIGAGSIFTLRLPLVGGAPPPA